MIIYKLEQSFKNHVCNYWPLVNRESPTGEGAGAGADCSSCVSGRTSRAGEYKDKVEFLETVLNNCSSSQFIYSFIYFIIIFTINP